MNFICCVAVQMRREEETLVEEGRTLNRMKRSRSIVSDVHVQ